MLLPNKGLLILGLLLAMVSVADVATTIIAIQNGATEANPIVKIIINNTAALIAFKCVGIALIMFMVNCISRSKLVIKCPNINYFSLALCIGVLLGAVINNVFALKNMGLIL